MSECDCDRCAELEKRVQELEALTEALRRWKKEVDDRLWDLERGEVDPAKLSASDPNTVLPIQHKAAERDAGQLHESGNNANLYRATFVWKEFADRCDRDRGRLLLDSSQVKNILNKHDFPTNRNTVRRVMEFVARYSNPGGPSDDPSSESNLVAFKKNRDSNVLVADYGEWVETMSEITDAVKDHASDRFDQLERSEHVISNNDESVKADFAVTD